MAESQDLPPPEYNSLDFNFTHNDRRPVFSTAAKQRDQSDIVSPVSQMSSGILAAAAGFSNSSSPRPDTSELSINTTQPLLGTAVSFGGVSRVSYYSLDDKKPFQAFTEDIEPDTPSEHSQNVDWRFYVCFACICLMNFMSDFSIASLCTVLPSIAQDLSLTAVESFWITGTFLLCATIMQPLFMRLSLALGCKFLLIFGHFLFTVGNIISASAMHTGTLLAGRSTEGVGVGAIAVLTNLLLSQLCFGSGLHDRAAKILATIATQSSWLGIALGPIMGSLTAQYLGWQSIFWLQVVFGAICLIVVTFLTRLPYVEAGPLFGRLGKVEYCGWALLACSLSWIVVAISRAGESQSWRYWYTLLPLDLGVTSLILCWYNTSRVDPILPFSIFRNKSALVSCLGTLIHGALTTTTIYLLPIMFQLGHSSLLATALALAPRTFTIFVMSTICVFTTPLVGHRPVICLGWSLAAASMGFTLLPESSNNAAIWIPVDTSIGVALGMLAPSLLASIQSAASSDDESIHSTSLHMFLSALGRCLGLMVGSSIFLNSLGNELSGAVQASCEWGTSENAILILNKINSRGSAGLRAALANVYMESLANVWIVGCIVALVLFALSIWYIEDDDAQRRGDVAPPAYEAVQNEF